LITVATLVVYLPIFARYEIPALHAEIAQALAAEDMPLEQAEFMAVLGVILLFGLIMGLGLFWTIFNLVYFMRDNVKAALGDIGPPESHVAPTGRTARSFAEPANLKPGKAVDPDELWAARWRSTPSAVRSALYTVLGVGYFICMIMFFSFRGSGGHGVDEFRVGRPSPWLTWTSNLSGFQWGLHLSSSVAMAVVGLVTLAVSRRLEFMERDRVHSIAWHYAIWAVLAIVVLAIGSLSHVLSARG
jgi:hypothetical protein